jgi:hypothetical protein
MVQGLPSGLILIYSCSRSFFYLLLQLSAVIPPGFCVTVAALDMQIQENSQLQDAVAALEFECSTSRELGVIQEQCSK